MLPIFGTARTSEKCYFAEFKLFLNFDKIKFQQQATIKKLQKTQRPDDLVLQPNPQCQTTSH
jgi:hypothetical protein